MNGFTRSTMKIKCEMCKSISEIELRRFQKVSFHSVLLGTDIPIQKYHPFIPVDAHLKGVWFRATMLSYMHYIWPIIRSRGANKHYVQSTLTLLLQYTRLQYIHQGNISSLQHNKIKPYFDSYQITIKMDNPRVPLPCVVGSLR